MAYQVPDTYTVGEVLTSTSMNKIGGDLNAIATGWIDTSATLTYSSVDGPTGVVTTSVDLSGTIPVGARLKFTQTTVKYFIVTAINTTTITFYGGTDYTLANAAITSPAFSLWKAPVGFNASPAKWTETLRDTADQTQGTPTSLTWYNLGSLSLSFPIGVWKSEYEVALEAISTSATDVSGWATLSTGSTTESDVDLTVYMQWSDTGSARTISQKRSFYCDKTLTIAAKTTYFLNAKMTGGTPNELAFRGSTGRPTIIRAVCALL